MRRYPMLKVMKDYGNAHPTREEYINFIYAGTPPLEEDGNLPAELEEELPEEFQRKEKVTHEEAKAAEENAKALVDAFIANVEHDVTESE